MIERVIGAFNHLGFDLDDTEIADILWLAVQMRRCNPSPVSEFPQETPATTPEIDPNTKLPRDRQNNSPKSITKTETSTNVYPQSSQDSSQISSSLPIKVPTAQALRNKLDISRSLKPLKRRVPSISEFLLDEIATAERIAEENLLLPVMCPARDRWLEIALVVDEGTSMFLWQQTIKEFKQLLERHGAFRDVRTWGLFTNRDNKVWLRPRTGNLSRQKRLHNPRELIDPNGRRLFIIISDCVSPAWYNGAITKTLAAWASTAPTTIIQVLPEWLWERSALGVAESILLRGLAPGVPNQQLIMTALDLLDESDVCNRLKIPVVTLEPESLKNWARMVAGAGEVQTKGSLLATDAEILDGSSESTENSNVELTAKQRLQRFRLTASPMARKLAGLLAAAPVSLPVVRLIQQTMLDKSSQVHVAEVFLGGILKPLSSVDEYEEADKIQFDFADGVRDLLLDGVPLTESTEVLRKVSEYVAARVGLSVDEFTAMLVNPGLGDRSSGVLVRPFAQITAKVLRRLGGKYAELAEEIEQQAKEILVANPKLDDNKTAEVKVHPQTSSGHRYALVIGINKYPLLKDSTGRYNHLTTPASDAEALAQLLEAQGNFRVKRFPASIIDGKMQVDPDKVVKTEELEAAILDLFLPDSGKAPETALLFFAGHGLRKQLRQNLTQGYLAASDVNPGKIWGFSLRELWEILQQSPVQQQVIWLDCCFSGELLNFKDSELGRQSSGCDRSIIAVSHENEVAYQRLDGQYGVLTGAILAGLNPEQVPEDDWITNWTLAASVEQSLQKYYDLTKIPQTPLISNHGEAIQLVQGKAKPTSESQNEDAFNIQSRLLFNEILNADFKHQVHMVKEVIQKHQTAAFLIHGEPSHGQQVLVTRLCHLKRKWKNISPIKVNLGIMIFAHSLPNLWQQLNRCFGLPGNAQSHEIIQRVCERLLTQDVIFIFNRVNDMQPRVLSGWLQEFWQPLVAQVEKRCSSPQRDTHLLMFLVDNNGSVCKSDILLAEKYNEPNYPLMPLNLPPISPFSVDVLNDLLDRVAMIPKLQLRAELTAQTLLEKTENGVPEFVYEEICDFCGHSWGELAKWLI
ncbi:MAG: SAV_2336 N-terminal domain-related protein [Nostoc sp. ChiQUE01a]|nr:SAV_2336 N-terminal domain-related protein [Nostoc sp. ChiQUE01a]